MCIVVQGGKIVLSGTYAECVAYVDREGKGSVLERTGLIDFYSVAYVR